jgi:hypothetical protein
MGKRILTILCALASLASAATPVDTIGSGDSTIIYPDNSRIYVQPNNSVTANDFTLGNNCTLVIGKFANMTIACKATTGSGCEIILESGSTLQINTTASLTLDKETHLNCKNGSLMLYAADSYLCLSADCTLSLGVIPVSGSGTIIAPKYTEDANEQGYAFLDAPCAYIFNGVKVTGMWHINRAYPLWFAAPGCDDWSVPINKAIELKRTGEVFLQRGVYPVKQSIRVRYGIELTGENGFISNPGNGSNSDLLGTTIVANNDSLSCFNFQSDYMVLVNTKPVEQYPSSSEPIEEQFNMWVHPYPAFTTVVRNITFMNGDKSERIIPQLNGLFTAGGLDIEQCRFLNFKQAIVKSRDYADGFVIKDCRFSGVNIVHYAPPGTTSATDTTVYDTKWMIYLNGDGDNLQFTGNAFMGSRFLNNRTLYVGRNRGGLISCNITGGEIVLNGCRGLTFSNNHMESSMESNEGMLIRVLNSQVTISDNFFYKSERGNIYVAGGGYGTPSVAEIHNNTYLCTFHDLFPGITNDSIQDYYSLEERRTEFEAKKKIWLARSSAPEIIVGDGATVNISNQYRQVALLNSVTWPLTVGIQFRAENQNDSIFLTDTIATTLLNNLSPYLSGSGTINAGFAVNNVNHQLHNINRRTATMMPNRNDRWYAESGEYEYFAVFVIDRQRNIIAYPNGMKYKHLKNKGDTIIKKNNFIDNPVDANAVSTLIPIYGGTYFPKWSGYLRMYRCRVERDTIINKIVREFDWNTVDVPVVNAMMLYDNGLFLSGYPWQKCSEANPLGSLPDTDTLKLQDVTHLNESVECTATTKPSSLPDTWSRGDKIFNVGNETDWDVFIKR